jgi:hypothetical protein
MASGPLTVHDRARDLEQSVVAAFDALDEPARLLQLILEIFILYARIAAVDHAFVLAVDVKSRREVGVEFRAPHAFVLLDDHVGHDVTRGRRLHCRAGTGIEPLDQLYRSL